VATVTERLRLRQHRSTFIAAITVFAFVIYVVQESWAGRPITGDSLLFFVVVGVTLGSLYAVAAAGLVVTYTTSGIFNFAQGAMGMLLAFVYWELKINAGIQTFVALCLTVLVAAPILGAFIERVFMRRLTTAPLVSQIVVTIGLMLFLIGLAATFWDPNETRSVGTFFGSDGFNIGQTFVPYYRMITVVAGLLLALGIRLLLYRTRLGVAMRAVVDNRELAALNGARPGLTSQFSWMLGTSMAALAGIFLAEELSTLSIETLTLLIIDAFAAAIIGRLKSLPMTYVGGMIIGLSLSFQANFLTWSGRWSPAGQAIPTIILFLALLFLPQARIEGRRIGRVITPRLPTIKRALFGFAVLIVTVFVLVGLISRPDVRTVGLALVTSFIMLSLVPLIGWSGQISLAQITFVGVGAWAAVEFANGGGQVFGLELFSAGSPWLLLVGALVAVPIGVLMALPALRLQGLYLALASLAFARLAEFVIFDQPEVFGGAGRRLSDLKVFGQNVTEPFGFLGLDFPQDAGFVIVITVMFCIFGFGIVLMRRGAFGRRLLAMKDSPAACATLGVNLLTTKVAVFALSAAIAGFGGAMLGMLRGSASTANFQVLQGLPYVILIVVGGAAVVSGALLGGFLFQLPVFLLDRLGDIEWSLPLLGTFKPFLIWNRLATGLLGIALGRRPEGIVPEVSSELDEKRRKRHGDDQEAAAAAAAVPPSEPAAPPATPVATPGS
jgi:branched-subunit amino acid ABC-type transport system permease component